MFVIYFVGEHIDDKPHKRNSVRLTIRKVMYAPSKAGEQPSIEVSKEFMMKPNKIHLEASLDKELYHHGETISVNVHVANNSNRTVKKIKVCVRQFADICLFSTAQYKSVVAEMESEDGCQVLPGFTLSKVFELCPLLANNKDKWGLALDGQLKHEDTNLASSTLITNSAQRESLGIIVHYKVKVKLLISGPLLGGDLVAELPFTLMHPKPEEDDNLLLGGLISDRSPRLSLRDSGGQLIMIGDSGDNVVDSNVLQVEMKTNLSAPEVPTTTNLIQLDDDDSQDDDIIFEDFARLRLKGAETEA